MYYEYEFRKCGNSWRYCNGKCNECCMTHATTTIRTEEYNRRDMNCDNKTIPNDEFWNDKRPVS